MQLTLGIDEYVVFDFETTGLSPWGGDEIIEIGAMKIYGNEIDEANAFHTLVNPNRIIPEDAIAVHGITNEMVADAPPLEEAVKNFIEFIDTAWLVAQNAKFDMGFLMKYLVAYNIRRDLEVYDTIQFSRRVFPEENRHNLDVICQRLGLAVNSDQRHRSIEDVRLTARAFLLMRDRLGTACPNREKWTV